MSFFPHPVGFPSSFSLQVVPPHLPSFLLSPHRDSTGDSFSAFLSLPIQQPTLPFINGDYRPGDLEHKFLLPLPVAVALRFVFGQGAWNRRLSILPSPVANLCLGQEEGEAALFFPKRQLLFYPFSSNNSLAVIREQAGFWPIPGGRQVLLCVRAES